MTQPRYGQAEFDDRSAFLVDGSKLKAIRQKLRPPTQQKLSDESLVSLARIKQIEQNKEVGGESAPIRVQKGTAYRLANALDVDVDDLKGELNTSSRSINQSELATAAQSFVTAANEVIALLPPSSPHLSFLSEHWRSVSGAIQTDTSNARVISEIDAHEYKTCLSALTNDDRRSIRAIADLTDPTERDFWLSNPRPQNTWAKERIFWIDWSILHNHDQFCGVLTMLRSQCSFSVSEYRVRLGVLSPRLQALRHPLGPNARGLHLLLIAPALVGGYVRSDSGENRNKIVSDERRFGEAERYYGELRELSIEVSSSDDQSALQRKLNTLYKIGDYDPQWKKHSARPPYYFDHYDENIRRWIPWYSETNALCASVIRSAIWHCFASQEHRPSILEIGFGTGDLTRHVLDWIDSASQLAHRAHDDRAIIDAYHGIDEAPQMRERLPKEIATHKLCRFHTGFFRAPVIRVLFPNRRIDVLCGSFVFHDIIDGRPADTVTPFLEAASRCLTDDGVLIMADVFVAPDEKHRRKELLYWDQGMRAMGMTDEQIANFRKGNPDMENTASEDQLAKAARACGFTQPEMLPLPQKDADSIPFKVMTMHRIKRSKIK